MKFMSRLDDLYKAMQTLRSEGLPVDDNLERKANELEEEIIKKEIFPLLSEKIAPALKPVKRELVLVVDYAPDKPLSVHLSRRRNFTAGMSDIKEIVLDPKVEHSTSAYKIQKHFTKSARTILSVQFPNGTIIQEKTAAATLFSTVKKIGVADVRKVVEEQNLKFSGVPVISNRRDSKYGNTQKDLGNGWLLVTHSNNEMKRVFLERVSQAMKLNLKIRLD